MAHIYDLAPSVSLPTTPNYTRNRLTTPSAVRFPQTDVFRSINTPSRFEGDVFDLEFSGTIPPEINGTFYRIQPDHRFPPLFEDDIHFNGDGSVTAIRIANGHADFKQRYVHTQRYKLETAARKSLFGRYRNPFTDNESVRGVIRTASNTNITFWRGMLLASKEDGPPHAMDPETLETLGRYDFEGQILSPTFTAHPKFDPETGEMLCFAYEAGGDGADCSIDVGVWTLNADGKKTEEAWYKAPFAGMIHDAGGEQHPQLPEDRVNSPHQLSAGYLTPKQAKSAVTDLPHAQGETVWVADERVTPSRVWLTNGEFSRIDDRCVTKPYRHFWQAVIDPSKPYDFAKCGPPAGGMFNSLGHYVWDEDNYHASSPDGGSAEEVDVGTQKGKFGSEDVYFAGPTMTFQEPTFIPRTDGKEGEGYLIALLNHLDTLRNDVVIFDAQDLKKGPVAVIHLPRKLKLGLHGNFLDHRDIEAWKERRKEGGDVGLVKVAGEGELLPWQVKYHEEESKDDKLLNGNGV
ncbi:carotenoid oxygenase [Rhypophila sp. PSN 637]